jgi:hypothetical protein
MPAKNLFLIASLPRSGGAWLSTVLNLNPKCFCSHEGEAEAQRRGRSLLEQMENRNVKFSGDACARNSDPRLDGIEAQRIFVARDLEDAWAATNNTFGDLITRPYFDHLGSQAYDWCKRHTPLVISYDALFTVETIEKLWEHLFNQDKAGLHPFPKSKIREIIKNRITQIIPLEELKRMAATQN